MLVLTILMFISCGKSKKEICEFEVYQNGLIIDRVKQERESGCFCSTERVTTSYQQKDMYYKLIECTKIR